MDDEIGVGADERQTPRGDATKRRLVILGRLVFVVEQAGAENVVGAFEIDPPRRRAGQRRRFLEQGQVALRANVMHRRVAPFGDLRNRDVAGGDDRIERVRWKLRIAAPGRGSARSAAGHW